MGDRPGALADAADLASAPAFPAMEALLARSYEIAGPEGFSRSYGIPEYAGMVTLGHERHSGIPVADGRSQ
jgi:hypothetical protein